MSFKFHHNAFIFYVKHLNCLVVEMCYKPALPSLDARAVVLHVTILLLPKSKSKVMTVLLYSSTAESLLGNGIYFYTYMTKLVQFHAGKSLKVITFSDSLSSV